MKKLFLSFFLTLFILNCSFAQNAVITQWNFNIGNDKDVSTGTTTPIIGSGSIKAIGSATHSGYNSGFITTNNRSTDPDSIDNSGLQTVGYPAQGKDPQTAGIEISISTLGYKNIIFSWDQRHSNTASKWVLLQYSTDGGSNWKDYKGTSTDSVDRWRAKAGDLWNNNRKATFSGTNNIDDQKSVLFRIVSDYAPGTSSYAPATKSSSYGTAGTWRFDMITVSGDKIVVILSKFNLLTPQSGFNFLVKEGSYNSQKFSWNSSNNAKSYTILFDTTGGNFTNPYHSISAGSDTFLNITERYIDSLLSSKSLAKGDSVNLIWTVKASDNVSVEKLADVPFNITFKRFKLVLGTFNLITPPNNFKYIVNEGSKNFQTFSWQSSTNATNYTILFDNFNGDFTNPYHTINVNADTVFNLTERYVDSVLNNNLVSKGDSVILKWTVMATDGASLSAFANTPHNIILKRNIQTGLEKNNQARNKVLIYPNPSQNGLITITNLNPKTSIKIIDGQGKEIKTNGMDLQTSNRQIQLPKGVYFISVLDNYIIQTYKVLVIGE